MKKFIIIFFAAITGISSCKKDDAASSTTATNAVKFDFRGASYTLSTGISAEKDSTGSGSSAFRFLDVTASTLSGTTANTFLLFIAKGGTSNFIGTYTINAGTGYPMGINIQINGKTYSNIAYQNTSSGNTILPSNCVVAVTADANKSVTGTFTGELYEVNPTNQNAISTTKYNISNGSFTAPVN